LSVFLFRLEVNRIATKQIEVINTKENRQILYKYLSKFYGSNKAKELMLKHKDNLFEFNGLAYSLGKRSIEFFCVYFLQDTFTPKPDNQARKLAPIHFEIWNNLENMFISDSFDKLELIMPRGAAKTTVCDFALSVWAHCYKLSIYTLVAGKTEQDSIEFIRETRRAFEENPYIIHTFGQLIDTRKYTVNKLELELTNITKIQAISSSSSMRGKKFNGNRPSLIIADDYQSKSDVITQEARDKKYDTWQQDSVYAGDKAVIRNGKKVKMATKFIVLGTILHRDCFISRLLKDNSYVHMVEKAILVDDVDQLFNTGLWEEFKKIYFNPKDELAQEHGREFYFKHEEEMQYPVLWEDKYNCLDLALDYYSNPQAFKQEMQNDASKIGEKAFHQITTVPREEIEKESFTNTILCCDPAVETKANNDYTALLVGSKSTNNFRRVRKGLIKRLTFDEYIDKVIELLKEYEDIKTIWIEKNTFNGTDKREIEKRIQADVNLATRRISIVNERQNKNKEAKIRAISGKVDSGFIVFAEEDKDFTDQILAYEGEKFTLHDDAADVVAEFDRLIDELNIPRDIKSIPKEWLF
jgi:predicted phage terminase large subunit-like protein